MRVKALGSINSGQYNAGDEFDLSDSEAKELVEAGAVVSLEDVAEEEVEANEEVLPPTEPVEPPSEATATPAPLEAASDLPLETPPESQKVEVKTPKQPTQSEIDKAIQAAEAGSSVSPDTPQIS